jgi:hypothetical protein
MPRKTPKVLDLLFSQMLVQRYVGHALAGRLPLLPQPLHCYLAQLLGERGGVIGLDGGYHFVGSGLLCAGGEDERAPLALNVLRQVHRQLLQQLGTRLQVRRASRRRDEILNGTDGEGEQVLHGFHSSTGLFH